MGKFCVFVENRTSEPLEIPKIQTIYHNDPFLRARKRLALHVDLKKSSAIRGKPGSPPTSTEVIAAKEVAERVQAEVEEEGEALVRKSKCLARGKAKVILPASPKRKDLPKLDEVPRKWRKFQDASTTVAVKVYSFLPFFYSLSHCHYSFSFSCLSFSII